jgi:hypothetical protein
VIVLGVFFEPDAVRPRPSVMSMVVSPWMQMVECRRISDVLRNIILYLYCAIVNECLGEGCYIVGVMMKLVCSVVFILGLLWWAGDAMAAPFCADAQGVSAECYYYDATQCRDRGREIGGGCRVNRDEIELPEGYGGYCMVTGALVVSCIYPDLIGCERDARQNNGVCALNPRRQAPGEDLNFDIDTFY